MRYVTQPPGTMQCGHACIAMVSGLSLLEVVEIVGDEDDDGIWPNRMPYWLRKAGCDVGKWTRIRPFTSVDGTAIIRLNWPKPSSDGHYVVARNGRVYDPSGKVCTHRMTSYLPILGATEWKFY